MRNFVERIMARVRMYRAAPEMLTVLKRVIAETESPGFLDLYGAYRAIYGHVYRGDMFCMAVREAIAKAEGRK